MGENLVAGILKNIETLANVNANQNVAILTGIKKTNTLLSDQIGKELSKQTRLLETMVSILLKGLKGNSKKEESSKGFSGGGALAAFAGMAKMLKKRAPKHISKLSKAIKGLAESMKLLIETINDMDIEKFDAFIKIFDYW